MYSKECSLNVSCKQQITKQGTVKQEQGKQKTKSNKQIQKLLWLYKTYKKNT